MNRKIQNRSIVLYTTVAVLFFLFAGCATQSPYTVTETELPYLKKNGDSTQFIESRFIGRISL